MCRASKGKGKGKGKGKSGGKGKKKGSSYPPKKKTPPKPASPKKKALPSKPRPVVDPHARYNAIGASRSAPGLATSRASSLLNPISLSNTIGAGALITIPPTDCALPPGLSLFSTCRPELPQETIGDPIPEPLPEPVGDPVPEPLSGLLLDPIPEPLSGPLIDPIPGDLGDLLMLRQDSGEEEQPPGAEQEGRRLTTEALTQQGYTIVGQEIRIEMPTGRRLRADFVAEREGKLWTVEAKGSAKGREKGDWTQKERREEFEQLGGVMYGTRAREAGLEGVQVPPGMKMMRLYWNTTTKQPYENEPGTGFPRP